MGTTFFFKIGRAVCHDFISGAFQDLDPEEFLSFKNKIVIKKADARKYEDELKKELTNWTALGQKDKVMKNMYPFVGCKYNINAVKLLCDSF